MILLPFETEHLLGDNEFKLQLTLERITDFGHPQTCHQQRILQLPELPLSLKRMLRSKCKSGILRLFKDLRSSIKGLARDGLSQFLNAISTVTTN